MAQTERMYEEKKDKKARKAPPVQLVQLAVCAVMVLSVYAVSRSQSALFRTLQTQYAQWTAEDYCADGVWTAAKQLAQTAFEPIEAQPQTAETTAAIAENAQIETVTSSGGEDIRVLDALEDSTFEAVTVSVPAVMPVQGKVTSGFGYRIHPVTGNRSFHTGVDIAAAEGTPIAAAYGGTVAETGHTSGRGNYVLLRHGTALQTLYCHLSEIDVEEGDSLTAGETLGLVGTTGMSTGPHLHFEVRVDGVRCDPVYVLRDLEYA